MSITCSSHARLRSSYHSTGIAAFLPCLALSAESRSQRPCLHMKMLEDAWLCVAGEIIPQALCSRFGLQIGAYSAWFVRILLWAVGIISFPISKVLDYLLGSEHGVSKSSRCGS